MKLSRYAATVGHHQYHYRVVKGFTINDKTITARLNERIDHFGRDSYMLIKRDGRKFKFEVNKAVIAPFIKLSHLVNTGDFL